MSRLLTGLCVSIAAWFGRWKVTRGARPLWLRRGHLSGAALAAALVFAHFRGIGSALRRHTSAMAQLWIRWIRNFLRCVGRACAALAMILAALGALTYAYAIGTAPWRLPELQYTMSRWSGVAVYDADDCFLGIIPGSREAIGDFSDGSRLPADVKTVPIATAPEGFWDVAVALEHHTIGQWRTLPRLGVDFLSLGKAVIDTASGNRRGASTLPQLVAGSLIQSGHGSTRQWARRKIDELLYGAALYSSYSLSPEAENGFRSLVANYLPLAQSTLSGRAGVLYGISVTGRILFDKAPHELSLAEQALLASAIKMPLVLAPEDDPAGQRLAQAIFDRLKDRAVYGLVRAYGRGTPSVELAITTVRNMALPTPRICAELVPYLPPSPTARFQALFSPVLRAQILASEELPQIVSELRHLAGPSYRDQVNGARLALRAVENLRFKEAVRRRLATIEHAMAPALPVALTAGGGRPVADILMAAADRRGDIRLYYQSSERSLLDVPRQTGSVAKIIAALSLAQRGSPDDLYCNRRIDGILHNAGGDTGRAGCTEPGGLFSARHSFKHSLNLPIFAALQSEPEERLRMLLADTGFSTFAETPITTALAFGMVTATPADMLRLISAVGSSLDRQPPVAPTPRMIVDVSWRASAHISALPPDFLDLSSYLSDPRAVRFAEATLSAPLSAGGTASALTACRHEAVWTIAKTGTVAQSGRVLSKLLLATGAISGEPLSLIGIIGLAGRAGDISPITTARVASILCDGLSGQEVAS